MTFWGFSAGEWLVLLQHELLLFAAVFFLLGALDEFAVDLGWLWLKLTGRAQTPTIGGTLAPGPLDGRAVVFIPAWQEEAVIGATIRHALAAWPQEEMRLYVGCYFNDVPTIAKVIEAAGSDSRVRLVINDAAGPTTKADCLNRLYSALAQDEARSGTKARMVVLHDAEDMVDPAALAILDRAMDHAELVQLPVLPTAQRGSRWIGSHYAEEFAEAHGKAMVVRDAIGAGMPLAGVGCAISRDALGHLARHLGTDRPFATDSLTEDYELGLGLAELGARSRFLRFRHADGRLVATRACFPATLETSVRQKTRWVHGISLQGWDRLGWRLSPAEFWMRLRDRRGPMAALVLGVAYALIVLTGALWSASAFGLIEPAALSPVVKLLLAANLAAFVWRAVWRFAFTTREYGAREGVRAVLRIPLANVIAILAGRRALQAYLRSLAGQKPRWDKTEHFLHPARDMPEGLA